MSYAQRTSPSSDYERPIQSEGVTTSRFFTLLDIANRAPRVGNPSTSSFPHHLFELCSASTVQLPPMGWGDSPQEWSPATTGGGANRSRALLGMHPSPPRPPPLAQFKSIRGDWLSPARSRSSHIVIRRQFADGAMFHNVRILFLAIAAPHITFSIPPGV